MGSISSSLLAVLFGVALLASLTLMIGGVNANPSYSPEANNSLNLTMDYTARFTQTNLELRSAMEGLRSGSPISFVSAIPAGIIAVFSIIFNSIDIVINFVGDMVRSSGIPIPQEVFDLLTLGVALWMIMKVVNIAANSDV